MEFLKHIDKEIKVKSKINVTVQCQSDVCDYWGKQSGGVLEDRPDKAVFICPECNHVNYVKWMDVS